MKSGYSKKKKYNNALSEDYQENAGLLYGTYLRSLVLANCIIVHRTKESQSIQPTKDILKRSRRTEKDWPNIPWCKRVGPNPSVIVPKREKRFDRHCDGLHLLRLQRTRRTDADVQLRSGAGKLIFLGRASNQNRKVGTHFCSNPFSPSSIRRTCLYFSSVAVWRLNSQARMVGWHTTGLSRRIVLQNPTTERTWTWLPATWVACKLKSRGTAVKPSVFNSWIGRYRATQRFLGRVG